MSFLIASGTAICGGSAIAAVASAIRPNNSQISVALGIVFILNSIALLLFPFIGDWLALSQYNFGVWSAIAIHDTSAVAGASEYFDELVGGGNIANQTALTIKMMRALWIIPLTFFAGFWFGGGRTEK